jgi:hypothetical protein
MDTIHNAIHAALKTPFCQSAQFKIITALVKGITMGHFEDHFELNTPSDEFFDFCLWEYPPQNAPLDKFKSINLLLHSFQTAGLSRESLKLVHDIRTQLGENKTVWGVKNVDGVLSWELYFYDYERLERDTSITKLLDVFKPNIHCPLNYDETTPYFMFSIDLDDKLISQKRGLEEINIYIGNPSTAVSSGICYSLTKEGLTLNNLYYFFDRKEHWEDIVNKTACSAHMSLTQLSIKDLLWPELIDCETIVVANKKNNDGLYFSRINIDQLIGFLKRCNYPLETIRFVEQHRNTLDHMLYDVGIDYTMKNGEIEILKSAYYGFF